jgi:MFS family permease
MTQARYSIVRHHVRPEPKPVAFLKSTIGSEFRKGWRVLCVATIGLPICFIPSAAGSVFIVPLTHAFGWSLTSIGAVGIVGGIAAILCGPVDGYLIDRLGFRTVILLYIAAFAACIVASASMGGSILIYCLITFGSSLVSSGWTTNYVRAVSGWFRTARGAAIGVMFTAGGIGCSIAPLFAQLVITHYGWRVAYLVLAGLVLSSWPLAYRWLRPPAKSSELGMNRPLEASDEGMSRRDAAKTPFFRLVSLAWMLSGLAGGGMFFLVPFLSAQGMSADAAAGCLSASYAVGAIVHPLLGLINDRWYPPLVAACAFLLNAIALALLGIFGAEHALLACLLMGIGISGLSNSFFNCIPKYFGLRSFGEVSGLIQSIGTAAGMIGPLLFSVLRDYTGAYTIPYIVVALITAAAGVCMFRSATLFLFRLAPISS